MPVVLPRLEEDAVARADLLDGSSLALAQANALGHEDRLTDGWVCHAVRAPGAKWTRAEAVRAGGDGAATASM